MKRSEINAIMRDADDFIRAHGFYLPPFAYWTPQVWATKGEEVREIVDRNLGWDITDFGQGDYASCGLFIFTIRNGDAENLKAMRGKLYAEKILVVDVDQITPMHFHWRKTEDGTRRTVKAGDTVVLSPGESITLTDHLYHKFWGAESRVLVGEVSLVNDDNVDNRFFDPVGRFPAIEEDEPPLYLLCNDYARYYRPR
jgi:D-lyxose ketol-isomerase